ncbi:type II toxin-antitoxin system VapC family toxin [Spongisporangium articulatum]|uniref:Ribonuclease VapC n=1 Tax=Spongisporangium articulatum TaxID=3362603 RepID=A0ABW8AKG5_9ACTN
MTRATYVCDASAIVAALTSDEADGQWAAQLLAMSDLAAPHLALFESANILRRLELSGALPSGEAAQAHADLLRLPLQVWPYEVLAERSWQLRGHLSIYDASHVALAELLDVPLVTLDRGIAGAPGPRCTVLVPDR